MMMMMDLVNLIKLMYSNKQLKKNKIYFKMKVNNKTNSQNKTLNQSKQILIKIIKINFNKMQNLNNNSAIFRKKKQSNILSLKFIFNLNYYNFIQFSSI